MSTDDQNADLEAIRARYAASTPGTWRWVDIDGWDIRLESDSGADPIVARADALTDATIVVSDADAAFIAHAHQDIPWLVDEVVRLRADNAALEAVVRQLRVYLTTPNRDGENDDRVVEAYDAMCAAMKAYDGTEPVL